MRLAVDVGYGAVKAVSAAGARATFPSVIALADEDGALEQALGVRGADRLTVTDPAGHTAAWLVGDAALALPGAHRPWATQAADRTGYDVLVWGAVARLAPPGGPIDLDVILGLPLGVYGAQRDALAARFRGAQVAVAASGGPARPVRVTRVWVLPQAAGAYYAAALTPSGHVQDPRLVERPVGVVDVGYRTTDTFVMAPDGAGTPRPVRALSGSFDTGTVAVFEAVRRRVEAATGHLVDPIQIERALRVQRGVLTVWGRDWDLRPWVAEEAARIGAQVRDAVRAAWGRELTTLGAVLLAGGGALLLGEALRAVHPTAVTVADPVFANAAGFLAARAMLEAAPA